MKLVMTLLVRDEEDVIEQNIRYHLSRGVDHVIVTDNRSVDGTRRIVENFCRRGVATLIDEPADDYAQAQWVTRMARAAAELGADWVINADADEFWWPERGDLKAVLARVPAEASVLSVRRVNFLPERVPSSNPLRSMIRRDAVSLNAMGRVLPGKVLHRAAADVEVGPGNHRAEAPSLGLPVATTDLVIFHYPYRSYEQFASKIANGGASLRKNTTMKAHAGAHWRMLYALLLDGTLRAWYDARPFAGDPQTDAALAAGTVVADDRLARYLDALAADGDPARAAAR